MPNGLPWRFRRISQGMRRHSAGSNFPTLNRAPSLPSISATRARRNFGKQSLRGDKGGGDDEYSFDGNGRLTYDPNKGVEVSYDLTGVPSTVIIGDVLNSYTYSADGVKQRVYSHFYGHMAPLALDAVPMGRGPLDGGGLIGPGTGNDFSVFRDTRYCGPFVLESDTVSMVLFPGGFCTMSGGQPTFHYYVRNHRGDNCGVVSDSGVFEQKTFYYPFGGIRGDVSTTPSLQPYKHSGKEWDHLGGLDWYDYGARMYDPALGMWTSGDPLAEKSPHMSIYSFCGNDPVNSFDPDGRKIKPVLYRENRKSFLLPKNYTSMSSFVKAMEEFGKTTWGKYVISSFVDKGKYHYGVQGNGKYSDISLNIEEYNLNDRQMQTYVMLDNGVKTVGQFHARKDKNNDLYFEMKIDASRSESELAETIVHELTLHGALIDETISIYREQGIDKALEFFYKTTEDQDHENNIHLYEKTKKELLQNKSEYNNSFLSF